MEQQAQGRARLVGTAVLPVDVVGEHQRLHLLRLVVPIEEVAQAAGQEGDHLRDLVARDAPEARAHTKGLEESRKARGVDVGRRLQEERLEVAGELLEALIDPRESLCVARALARQLRERALPVRPPGHDVAVGERYLQRGIAGHHAETACSETQVSDDLRTEHARNVGSGGGAAPGRHLLRDAAAAQDVAPLEEPDAKATPREIGGGGESVVAPAHHDCVVAASRAGRPPVHRSRRISAR